MWKWLQRYGIRRGPAADRDRDLNDEIQHHLALRTDDLIRTGLSPEDAGRLARLEFGSVEGYRERLRDGWGWGEWFAAIGREYRIAVRRLHGSPLYAGFSIVTLALGIGITTAVYSVVYHYIWPSTGIVDEEQLITIHQYNRVRPLSQSDFRELVAQQHSFSHVAARTKLTTSLSAGGTSTIAAGEVVTGQYFELLGVKASVGRTLNVREDDPGSPPAAILSHLVWRKHFHSDPALVGTTIQLGQQPFTVVGVVESSFRGLEVVPGYTPAFWVPVQHARLLTGGPDASGFSALRRELGQFQVLARARPGISIEQMTAEIGLIGRRLDEAQPLPNATRGGTPTVETRAWTVGPAVDSVIDSPDSSVGRVILGLPALVFLIACTNLANLALSRGVGRRQGVAVRRALGASRARVVREETAEGVVIAVVGGLLGVGLARLLLAGAERLLQDRLAVLAHWMTLELPLSAPVLLAALATTLLAIVAGSLLPAWHLTRTSLRQTLAVGNEQSAPRWRGRGNLIALQVGASVGLFLVAFSSVRLLAEIPRHLGGPQLDDLAVATIPFETQRYDEGRARAVLDEALEALRGAPGVSTAAVVGGLPDMLGSLPSSYHRPAITTPASAFTDREQGQHPTLFVGTPDLFDVLELGVLKGRAFSHSDTAASEAVVVVNDALATALFGTTDVIGRQVLTRMASAWEPNPAVTARTVVGVVPMRYAGRRGPSLELYLPLAQHYDANVAILARGMSGGPVPVASLRDAIRRTAPDLAVIFLGSGATLGGAVAAIARVVIGVASGLAGFALVLAMAGLFGVLSDVVARRTREIGIRLAVGADARRIARMVLKDGLRPVVEGLLIGLGSAMVIRQLLRATYVDDMSAIDPGAFLVAVVLLLAAGVAACYLPARRASRVAPSVALRDL